MEENNLIIGSVLLIAFISIYFISLRKWLLGKKRKKIREMEFPQTYIHFLEEDFPIYKRLPESFKKALHGNILIFLHEVPIEGCGGLEVDERMKLLIGAQACILLTTRDEVFFPILKNVFVYPSSFKEPEKSLILGRKKRSSAIRLGESWNTGTVVLAWDAVRKGAVNFKDGQNVMYHEFAHQLDQADSVGDGTPLLESPSHYKVWAQVFEKNFKQLIKKKEKRKKTLLNKYGATNPAEFFAVATEAFFEKAKMLKKKHPELYQQLSEYYEVEPEKWS